MMYMLSVMSSVALETLIVAQCSGITWQFSNQNIRHRP